MTANWWTLVPLRGIAGGKSRLAPVLDAAARAVLNRFLLVHTLGVIGQWRGDLARCLLVSPCEEALEIAHGAGALVLREQAGGLNAALAFGAAQAARRGADKLLIVACDLPELNADALAALAEPAAASKHAGLAPDRAGTGTNALVVDADAADIFAFGVDSCRRHLAAFRRISHQSALCRRMELAFDLDTPQDHAEWLARRGARIPRAVAQSGYHQIAEAGK